MVPFFFLISVLRVHKKWFLFLNLLLQYQISSKQVWHIHSILVKKLKINFCKFHTKITKLTILIDCKTRICTWNFLRKWRCKVQWCKLISNYFRHLPSKKHIWNQNWKCSYYWPPEYNGKCLNSERNIQYYR